MADSASAPAPLDFFALFETDDALARPAPPDPPGPPEKPAVFIPPPPVVAPPKFITPPGSMWLNDHAGDECGGAVATYYAQKGWTLIPIPWAEKGGKGMPFGWQHADGNTVPAGHRGNLGLIHARSGTCAIDIDHLRLALDLCEHYGVDLKALLDAADAVQIDSQRGNHGKLLYGLMFPLPSLKVYVAGKPVIDFRCATQARDGVLGAGVQDVLPPSLHPDTGKPYLWGGKGDWRCLPDLPGGLLDLWSRLRAMAGGGSELRLDTGFSAGGAGAGGGAGRRLPATGAQWSGQGCEGVGWARETPDERAQKARDALGFLDPDMDRPAWVEIGMSFHAAGGDYATWDAWSARGVKYAGAHDTGTVWNSFNAGDGVGPGTLFAAARAAGWTGNRPPRLTVEEMFPASMLAALVAPAIDEVVPWVAAEGSDAATVAMVSESVDLEALKEDLRLVTEQTPLDQIGDILRRMVIAATQDAETWSEMAGERAIKALAKATKIPVATLRREYRGRVVELRKATGRGALRAGQPRGAQGLLANALARLSCDALPDPRTLDEMATRYIWLPEQAAFYDRLTARWVSTSGFNGRYAHLRRELAGDDDRQASPSDLLLESPLSIKPDIVDYWPGKAPVYLQTGVLALNAWVDDGLKGVPGDVSLWLAHLEWLLPNAAERKHLLQWMAFCIKHQERKINHSILFGGLERTGKDALFQPLIRALGDSNVKSMSPSRLNEPYEDDFAFKKLTILNELHDSDMSHTKLENKLKKFGAAPPNRITLRMFGEKHVTINNVVQMLAFTNHRDATVLRTSKERWACYWCAPTEAQPPEYYTQFYHWLDHGGAEAVIHYLMTEVDLADFNNGGTAPETEWQHALSALGEHADPLVEAVKYHIENRSTGWEKDIIKIRDVVSSLQNEFSMLDKDLRINAKTVARALTVAGCVYSGTRYRKKPETDNVDKILLWAIRNTNHWEKQKGEAWWAEYDPTKPAKPAVHPVLG